MSGRGARLSAAIIAISFLSQGATMLSPVLSTFARHFLDVGETAIQAIVTLPSLISIPFLFVGGGLSRKVSSKHMLLLGVIIFSLGGLLPLVISSFSGILVCRMIMGAGLGLLTPFSQSLISDNFEGEGITKMFGLQAASISAGNMVGCYLSGLLARISYQAAFLCYLMGPAAFLIALFCVPKRPAHSAGEGRSALRDYLHIPLGLWLRYLFQMVFALAYFSYFTNTSLLMEARGAGDSATTGVTTALSSIVGIGAGLLMPWLHRRLRSKLLPVMVLCMLLGVVVELRAHEALLFHGASFLIGFAYSVVMPYMVANVTHAAPGLNHTVTSSLFLAATSIGASTSAVVLEAGAGLLGLEGPEGQLCLGLMLLIVLLLAALIASVRLSRRGHTERMRST